MEIKDLYKLYQTPPCITTDSRDCPEGSIFLALKGDKFDGNLFAEGALQKGFWVAMGTIILSPPGDDDFIVLWKCQEKCSRKTPKIMDVWIGKDFEAERSVAE